MPPFLTRPFPITAGRKSSCAPRRQAPASSRARPFEPCWNPPGSKTCSASPWDQRTPPTWSRQPLRPSRVFACVRISTAGAVCRSPRCRPQYRQRLFPLLNRPFPPRCPFLPGLRNALARGKWLLLRRPNPPRLGRPRASGQRRPRPLNRLHRLLSNSCLH